MPGTLACLTISAEGGKTRVSFRTDSICADMTTVSSFLVHDKQKLHRAGLCRAPVAMVEIIQGQPYATLTPGPRRANQSIFLLRERFWLSLWRCSSSTT